MVNLRYKNNVGIELVLPILSSAGSIVLPTGAGDLIGTDFPIKAKLTQKNATNSALVDKREIILITARPGTSDTLTVTRASEAIPLSSSSVAHQQAPQDFASGSFLEIVDTAGTFEYFEQKIDEIETIELPLKLDKSTYNAERQLFIASSTGDDDYEITSVDVVAYNNGQTFKIQADVANTGPATLKLNALAAKPIEKIQSGAFVPLETGDIIANQIFWATYNALEDCFQFSVDPATIVVPSSDVNNFIDSAYPVGEDVTALESLFIEPVTPQASATNFQNFGDVSANKRISFPIFGSGVSGDYLEFLLKRILTTTTDPTIRIETDNAGSPSGTLFDPTNSVTTIPRASILTAPGNSTDNNSKTLTNQGGDTASLGFRIYSTYTSRLTAVTIASGCTATRVRLLDDSGTVLATATVSSLVATFNYVLAAGTHYRIEADNSGASYNYYDGGSGYPINRTNINYISASQNGAGSGTGNSFNIQSITTEGGILARATFPGSFTIPHGQKCHVVMLAGTYGSETVDGTNYYQIGYATNHTTTRGVKKWNTSWGSFENTIFPFISSPLFRDTVLSKTSATYSYKVKFYGFAFETKTVGLFPKVVIGGLFATSGLTKDADYFLANTAGTIATTPGTNVKRVGTALDTTQLEINKLGKSLKSAINGSASGTATEDMFVTAYGSGTSGQTMLGVSDGNTLQSVICTSAGGTTTHAICFPVRKGATWSVSGSMTISTSNIWQTPLS